MDKRLKFDIGQRFGKLTVISDKYEIQRSGVRMKKIRCFLCRCDCGKEKLVAGRHLKSGKTRSCGCLIGVNMTESSFVTTPGLVRAYRSWTAMMSRCTKPNAVAFANYGGRGIKVCERWLISSNFLEDMGERPENTTLGRKDNDKNYEPDNCRWETTIQQSRNKRSTLFVEYEGIRVKLTDLCERLNKPLSNVHNRLRLGWPLEEALNYPIGTYSRIKKIKCLPVNNNVDTKTESTFNAEMSVQEITGSQFCEWRKANGWSRSWIASQLGVSNSSVWKWENSDKPVPKLVTTACCAINAHLSISDFLKGESQ